MTSGIIEILTENAGVQALVGRTPDNAKYKVYPVVAEPDDAAGNKVKGRYMVVWQSASDVLPSLTKDEPSTLDYPRINVACYDKNYRPTELMGEVVRVALEEEGVETNNGYFFNRIWLVDERETYETSGMFVKVLTFACEVKRSDGSVFQVLIDNNFSTWAGTWNWAAHSNNLPNYLDVIPGRVWLTEDDRGVPGDANYYPANTLMVAINDGGTDFSDFTFNLA